jgi:hypothetical protein
MQRYTVYLYLETALHVSGGTSTIIRSANNCIYSIWYLSDRYCYLPRAAGSSNGNHPKHVEHFPDINKLCNVASCWIYIRTCDGYGLDGLGNRIPVEARFSAPVQAGPGANPTSCTMGTGSFLGVKSGRGVTLTSLLLLVPWS